MDILGIQGVGRADDPLAPAHIEHVGVDHGRFNILVTEKFLNGPDVIPGQQEMRGEGVPQGVAARSLVDLSVSKRLFDGLLND